MRGGSNCSTSRPTRPSTTPTSSSTTTSSKPWRDVRSPATSGRQRRQVASDVRSPATSGRQGQGLPQGGPHLLPARPAAPPRQGPRLLPGPLRPLRSIDQQRYVFDGRLKVKADHPARGFADFLAWA